MLTRISQVEPIDRCVDESAVRSLRITFDQLIHEREGSFRRQLFKEVKQKVGWTVEVEAIPDNLKLTH